MFISACLFESVVVVFIPLYTLAGFYIPPPPPRNASLLFPFTTFIFPKFLFYHFPYIIYSTFFIVLIVFPVLLFQCLLFRLLHVIFSNQFPIVFPVRRSLHFPNSRPVISVVFFFCQMSHSKFSSLLDCFYVFLFQLFYGFISCFPNSLPRISLMSCTPSSCLFFLRFSLFSFYSSFPLSPNSRTIC